MSFTVVPEEPARQLADPGSPEACPHCGRRTFWRNGCYERHLLLLVCCEWAHQGVVRLSPPVLALVEHVMDRWNDLVRCVRDPAIPSSTNGWFGRFKPRARLARGLKTPQGAQAFLHLLAGNLA
ncbi:MAG: hypothetical protein F4X16_12475 [Caldilineaceae bacterium SB0661_bin_34]|nr:hypothetical protein [Caldilineaceae bacterium SB0661_bin_34]